MPTPKIEITNPQAIELIAKIKSGEIFIPFKNWLKKNKWYLVSAAVTLILIIALVIGKKLSEGTPIPVFTPPDIESPSLTPSIVVKSSFSGIKDEIQNLNTDLPDPFIPSFDNSINLEAPLN